MSQLVNSKPLHPKYTVKDALKRIIKNFEARGANISIGNAKKYIKSEYIIWDRSIIPMYWISIETSNGYEYMFLIDGLTNNIVSHVVFVTAGNNIANANTINTNIINNNNTSTISNKNNKILEESKENISHKQSGMTIMILAFMIGAIIGIAVTTWLYISKRK
jgi:hypothetical protein